MSVLLKQEETNIRAKYTRAHIPNAVFFIPFGYYYTVRLGTISKLLSWALIYIMPTAFYSAVGYNGSWILFAINYLLVLIAAFSLYEYGYIINDTCSIRREEQPAIRLYDYNFAFFARWKSLILATRLFYAIIATSILYLLNADNSHIIMVVFSLAFMCLCFAIYNYWRNRYNVWFYPILVCSRFLPFMLIYDFHWPPCLLLFLSFPLLNALERFSMPRYRWPWMRKLIPDEQSKTLFRVLYYTIVLAVLISALFISGLSLILLTPIFLLFLYRLILLFWLRKHHPKNYLNG